MTTVNEGRNAALNAHRHKTMFKPGDPRAGAAGHKAHLSRIKALFNRQIATGNEVTGFKLTPLDYLLTVVNDDQQPTSRRIEAAVQAAPYCHQKLPQRVKMEVEQVQPAAARPLTEISQEALEALLVGAEALELAELRAQLPETAPALEHYE